MQAGRCEALTLVSTNHTREFGLEPYGAIKPLSRLCGAPSGMQGPRQLQHRIGVVWIACKKRLVLTNGLLRITLVPKQKGEFRTGLQGIRIQAKCFSIMRHGVGDLRSSCLNRSEERMPTR